MRTALVTGSTRGIGRSIADMLRLEGYQVVYSGSKQEAPDDFADDRDYCGCDIAIGKQREYIMAYIMEKYGRLDVMVNNAGVAPLIRNDLLEMDEESYDRVIDINLKGTFFMCLLAAKAMIACKQKLEEYTPRIINIGSISAYTSSTMRGAYCISKAGVAMVTSLFADRLACEGIPVFEVRPGIIETDMTKTVHSKYEQMIHNGLTPIERFGKPEDVARIVRACCSGDLDFACGQTLNADGGFHLRRL